MSQFLRMSQFLTSGAYAWDCGGPVSSGHEVRHVLQVVGHERLLLVAPWWRDCRTFTEEESRGRRR